MTISRGIVNTRTTRPAAQPDESGLYIGVVGTNDTSGLTGYTVPAVHANVLADTDAEPVDGFGNSGTLYEAQVAIEDEIDSHMIGNRWDHTLAATDATEYATRRASITGAIDALEDAAADVGHAPSVIALAGFEANNYTETALGVRTYDTASSPVYTELGSVAADLNAVAFASAPQGMSVSDLITWKGNNSHANVVACVPAGQVSGLTGDKAIAPSVAGLLARTDFTRGNVGGSVENKHFLGLTQASANVIRYNVRSATSDMQRLLAEDFLVAVQHPTRGMIAMGGELGATAPYNHLNVLRSIYYVEAAMADIAEPFIANDSFSRREIIEHIVDQTNDFLSNQVPGLFESAQCEPDTVFNNTQANIDSGDVRFQNTYGSRIPIQVITFNHVA